MTCIFLNTNDKAGTWLYGALKKKGVDNLVMIAAEELVYAQQFSCGMEDDGSYFSIRLQNGLEITNQSVHTTVNRINFLPEAITSRFKPSDRSYVTQEQMATFTFLFNILPGQLFNTSSGRGLNGQYRSQWEWLQLAKQAGLTTIEMAYENYQLYQTTLTEVNPLVPVLYFNGKCFGRSIINNDHLYTCCQQLGALSTDRIIEMYFRVVNQTLLFTGASTVPAFQEAGDDFINELKELL